MAAIFWNTGVSGNWSQKSNWSSGTVPGATDDVTIDAAGAYTVNANVVAGVNTFVFNASAATINLPSGDELQVTHGATITGGTIDGPGRFIPEGVSQILVGPSLTLGGGLSFEIFSGSSLSLSAPINIGDATGPNATILNEERSTCSRMPRGLA